MSTTGDSPQEWPATLDFDTLVEGGWKPRPFRQFLLKVHSRCNLACDYCYVYTMADQSWRSKPMVIDPQLVSVTAQRIAEHCETHGLTSVRVILHGGEPLLAGPDYLGKIIEVIRSEAGPDVNVEVAIQTNAILLDENALRIFEELDVKVGVSLDGDQRANDRNRHFTNGRGSHAEVVRALSLLTNPPYRNLYSGLLCTVDLANDPLETYEALMEFTPPALDFLIPHGTWDTPPPGWRSDPLVTPYADWLIAIFDRWYHDGAKPEIRLFDAIARLLIGRTSTSEAVGITPTTLVVIETDGTIEQTDSLKAVKQDAPITGLNIVDHSFDTVLRHPGIMARQLGLDALCETCRACPIQRVCGGGLYPHRYRSGSGFLNPSVYCDDLFRLIDHIHQRLASDLRRAVL